MKKIFKYIIVIFAFLFFSTACDTSLEEETFTFISPDGYYQNETELNAATIGVYNILQYLRGWDYLYFTIEILGEGVVGQGGTYAEDNFHNVTSAYSSFGQAEGLWQRSYMGILYANLVIKHGNRLLDEGGFDETIVKRCIAEAKFLRAEWFFWLVRYFERVPLVIEATTGIKNVSIPQSEKEDVYVQIYEDLEYAIANLPTKTEWEAESNVRASKGAAQSLMALAHITENNDYTAAKPYLEAVLQSGEYDLETEFKNVIPWYKENGPEIIMDVQFDATIGEGTSLWRRSGNNAYITTYKSYMREHGSIPFIKSYLPGDERPEANFIMEDLVQPNGTVVYFDIDNPHEDNNPMEGPVLRKSQPSSLTGSSGGNNIIMYRLAEIILLYAETLNEEGGPTKSGITTTTSVGTATTAEDYLNLIRARAKAPLITSGLDKETFKDSLYVETTWEYVGEEGKNFFTMLRMGNLGERTQHEFDVNNVEYKPGVKYNLGAAGLFKRPPDNFIFPIPQSQIDLDPTVLQQNDPSRWGEQ